MDLHESGTVLVNSPSRTWPCTWLFWESEHGICLV